MPLSRLLLSDAKAKSTSILLLVSFNSLLLSQITPCLISSEIRLVSFMELGETYLRAVYTKAIPLSAEVVLTVTRMRYASVTTKVADESKKVLTSCKGPRARVHDSPQSYTAESDERA